MKTYEPVILKKRGPSKKFPRKALHARKSVLGVGLMKPSTMIEIIALILCIGHKRLGTKIGKKISVNE